ncbi:MAG: PilW family protein, partial [Pseudomonadota bacterium]|nr:PilW family protein [Pseudomonadota bacterium]
VVNCAGFGVGTDRAQGDDGWSIFYVTLDRHGDPQLMCKYHGRHGWSSVAIAAGVESFQVLYGVADMPAGVATRFVRATELLQSAATSGVVAEQIWQRVVSVRLALLVRGAERIRLDPADQRFDLFGALYAQQDGMRDRGTQIDEATLPARQRGYLRRVFSTTTRLRNRSVDDERAPNTAGAAT